jgi:hypothetical protein
VAKLRRGAFPAQVKLRSWARMAYLVNALAADKPIRAKPGLLVKRPTLAVRYLGPWLAQQNVIGAILVAA